MGAGDPIVYEKLLLNDPERWPQSMWLGPYELGALVAALLTWFRGLDDRSQ